MTSFISVGSACQDMVVRRVVLVEETGRRAGGVVGMGGGTFQEKQARFKQVCLRPNSSFDVGSCTQMRKTQMGSGLLPPFPWLISPPKGARARWECGEHWFALTALLQSAFVRSPLFQCCALVGRRPHIHFKRGIRPPLPGHTVTPTSYTP